MNRVPSMLFVCTGNIFPRMTAEYALKARLDLRFAIRVSSAGTVALPQEMHPDVRAYLVLRAIDRSPHRQRKVSADLVIAMSTDHQAVLFDIFATLGDVDSAAIRAVRRHDQATCDDHAHPCASAISRALTRAPQFTSGRHPCDGRVPYPMVPRAGCRLMSVLCRLPLANPSMTVYNHARFPSHCVLRAHVPGMRRGALGHSQT
jgi:protein-tyrosine-phosphatase